MCGRLDFYLDTFATLKDVCPSTSLPHSLAPDGCWSALLMIGVIDSIESKTLTRNYILPSKELQKTYESYTFSHDNTFNQRPSMAVPFWNLQFLEFWELRWRHAQLPDIHITDIGQLREHIYGAVLSEELFPLLLMPSSREKLKHALIRSYRPYRLST